MVLPDRACSPQDVRTCPASSDMQLGYHKASKLPTRCKTARDAYRKEAKPALHPVHERMPSPQDSCCWLIVCQQRLQNRAEGAGPCMVGIQLVRAGAGSSHWAEQQGAIRPHFWLTAPATQRQQQGCAAHHTGCCTAAQAPHQWPGPRRARGRGPLHCHRREVSHTSLSVFVLVVGCRHVELVHRLQWVAAYSV